MIEKIQIRLARALESQSGTRAIRTNRGAALGSSVGLVRKRNEDCCLVVRASSYANGVRSNFTVAVVCDGLGGMSEGREAAILAASAFIGHLFCAPPCALEERLFRAVAYANSEVYLRLRADGGTTLSAVVSCQRSGTMLCHVGDSRIYGVSPDRTLMQLSRDDTIKALLKRGASEVDAPKDSRLLQFVGMGDEMEAQIASIPGQCRSILVTSDGAHDFPHSVLQRMVSAAAGGSDLIRNLLTLSDMLGGRDNASAILLPIGNEAELYDGIGDNELLAILPNDTLAICIAGSDAWERSGRMHSPSSEYPSRQPNERMEQVPPEENFVESEPEPKPGAHKGKGRTARPRKAKHRPISPKSDATDRLPLDAPSNEVDVRFSSPATQPEEDEQ